MKNDNEKELANAPVGNEQSQAEKDLKNKLQGGKSDEQAAKESAEGHPGQAVNTPNPMPTPSVLGGNHPASKETAVALGLPVTDQKSAVELADDAKVDKSGK